MNEKRQKVVAGLCELSVLRAIKSDCREDSSRAKSAKYAKFGEVKVPKT